MESITVYAAAPHGLEFTTLAALGISLAVVGMIVWHVVGRMRWFREDDPLGHSDP
ncbi:MAG: hypothetical protein ACREUT_12150 [Steroidobacteraceae bacterium]